MKGGLKKCGPLCSEVRRRVRSPSPGGDAASACAPAAESALAPGQELLGLRLLQRLARHRQPGMYLDGLTTEISVDCPGQTLFVSVNGSWIGNTKVSVSENHMQIRVNPSPCPFFRPFLVVDP